MDRAEAVALLRELINLNLAQPSFVSIEKDGNGKFCLRMKTDGDLMGIRVFLADKNLILYEDQKKGTCTIGTP